MNRVSNAINHPVTYVFEPPYRALLIFNWSFKALHANEIQMCINTRVVYAISLFYLLMQQQQKKMILEK